MLVIYIIFLFYYTFITNNIYFTVFFFFSHLYLFLHFLSKKTFYIKGSSKKLDLIRLG